MGNRDDLLAGARHCLRTHGYARTTARDIAAAAGVSTAAIGYHFGSKEALLNAALTAATGDELGNEFEAAITSAARSDGDRLERFEATWRHLIDALPQHRDLLSASLENLGQLEHVPEVRRYLAHGHREGTAAIAALLRQHHHELDERGSHALAALYYALFNGVMTLWLTDPATVPTPADLTHAIRVLTTRARTTRDA